MMCGRSPPAELILEIIKSNNSRFFLKEFGKGDNIIFVKISFCRISSRVFQYIGQKLGQINIFFQKD